MPTIINYELISDVGAMGKQVFLPEKKKEASPEIEGAIIKVRSTKKKQIENMVTAKKKNVLNVIRDWIAEDIDDDTKPRK